jgi:kynurenine formamidase
VVRSVGSSPRRLDAVREPESLVRRSITKQPKIVADRSSGIRDSKELLSCLRSRLSGTVNSILDLTHTLDAQTPTYEMSHKPAYRAKTVATVDKEGYIEREISLPEHFGTHLDAPAHFVPGLWTVDQIPVERFVAPLVVLNVTEAAEGNPDYQLSVADVAKYEEAHGKIPFNAVVVAYTGWDFYWNSAKEYRNADASGVLHFPGYSLDAAKFLVDDRNVVGLGIDTLSIDCGSSENLAVHHYTLSRSLYHLENLANLAQVSASGATVVVAPMKLEHGSGAPVRVLALI